MAITPITDIPISKLTSGETSLTGSGIFDVMMQAVEAHIQNEYKAKRITSDSYPTIYLGAMQVVLQQAVQYSLQVSVVERQSVLYEKQAALAERQAKGFDDDAKQKLLKQALDSWSVAYSVAQDANSIPDTIKVNIIDSIMKNAMDGLGIVKTNDPLQEI